LGPTALPDERRDGTQKRVTVHCFGDGNIVAPLRLRLDQMGLAAPTLRRRVLRAVLAGVSAAARELRSEPDRAVRDSSVLRAPRRLAAFIYWAFLVELGCLGLVLLEVELFLPGSWVRTFRVALGIVLLAGGLIFVPTRLGARSLVLGRLVPAGHAGVRRRRWRRLLLDLVIQLVSLAMLIGAALELARALSNSM
jgi:hypothetical protein